jgi:hypothetical protein
LVLSTTSYAASLVDIDDSHYYQNFQKIEHRVLQYQYEREKDFEEIILPHLKLRATALGDIGLASLSLRRQSALNDLYTDITAYQTWLAGNWIPLLNSTPLPITPITPHFIWKNDEIIKFGRVNVTEFERSTVSCSPGIRAIQSLDSITENDINWI